MRSKRKKKKDNKAGGGKQSLKGDRRGGVAAVPTDKGHVFGVAEAAGS